MRTPEEIAKSIVDKCYNLLPSDLKDAIAAAIKEAREIKLPDENKHKTTYDILEGDDEEIAFQCGFGHGWNDCRVQVKKLNNIDV